MSKRLQVIVLDDEYERIAFLAGKSKTTVSEFVRECLRKATSTASSNRSSKEKVSRILRLSKFNGPTGDIDQILAEIEQGRQG